MKTYKTSEHENKLDLEELINYASQTRSPICIKGKKSTAVIISHEEYRNLKETLYLQSIPGFAESLHKERAQPIEECTDKLDW